MTVNLNFSKIIALNNAILITIFTLLGFLSGNEVAGQSSTIREETKIIKTYPFSDPNPVPSLGIDAKVAAFYPYFIFDGFTDKGIDQNWKVVTLENDYIEVTVLPEQGGKVLGAIEKSTGGEFIYLNHVQKFRSIGIRGPWTSGGIEHNFGLDLGHAPWTASKVDYVLKKSKDGSVSCVVGGLDLASRTQWRVDIRLPEDKAYFETNSLWYNPTPLHDAYLSWENAAYKASDDLQFYFSGIHHIGHGGDVHPWPLDEEGRNISIYRNNNFGTSKSYHVFGLTPNWYGGYYHNTNFGTGHWAPYDDAPGKKIWIWSLSRLGAIWEGLLTDTDGQYIEAQSGVKFNQASPESGFNTPFNQLTMRPFYSETKSECWFPVKETGGMVDASPAGTLNIVLSEDSLNLAFCSNISINDTLIVRSGKSIILSEYIELKPMQVYKKSISFSDGNTNVITVDIGNDLLSYTSDIEENRVTRPIETPAGQDFNSAEHLFRQAEDMNSMRNYDEALETYLTCLKKEPTHSRALAKVAELYYRKAQYKEALGYAERVLENNTYDGNGNFIYGVIQKALGDLTNAKEGFSVAVRSMEFRSAAYVEIAGLYLQEGKYQKAKEYADKSLDYNKYNVTAYEFLATAFRKLNQADKAENTLEMLLEIDPLCHYAHFERYLLDGKAESLSSFNSAIQNELPYETYLELALEYANMGLNSEAMQVLEQSSKYPTVYYWLAYLTRETAPAQSEEFLKNAVSMSPSMVFPFRLETIPVLTWAQKQNPSWKSNYYLALIYWNILRPEKAREEFAKCENVPGYAPFYISRGIFTQKNNFDLEDAGRDFERAFKLDPGQWRTAYYLSTYYQSIGEFNKQLEVSEQMYARFPDNPVVGIAHAKSLLNLAKNQECLKVLEEVLVLPAEFANAGHGIYERANLNIALNLLEKKKYKKAIKYINDSKKWPENLGTGAPYEPDIRLQNYLAAYCESEMGNTEVAKEYRKDIVDYSQSHWDAAKDLFNNFFIVKILNDQGRSEEADAYMAKWENRQNYLRDWKIAGGTSSSEVQWVLAKYYKDDENVKNLEARIIENQPNSKFRIMLKAISHVEGK